MIHYHKIGKGPACGKEFEKSTLGASFASASDRCEECVRLFKGDNLRYLAPLFPGPASEVTN